MPKARPDPKPAPADYEEERITFDVVMRKLANTPALHKTAKAPAKPAAKKAPKKR